MPVDSDSLDEYLYQKWDAEIPTIPILVLPDYIHISKSLRQDCYEYHCERCNKWFDRRRWGYYDLYQHLHSKGHKERMELHASNYCSTCNIQFKCAAKMRIHIETTRHKKREAGTLIYKVHCEPCNMTFTCPTHYTRHIATKGHARRLLPPPKRDCEVCGVHVTTDKQMEAHLATKKHQRNVSKATQSDDASFHLECDADASSQSPMACMSQEMQEAVYQEHTHRPLADTLGPAP